MKRFVIILAGVIVLLLAAMVAVPYFFKDEIVQKVQGEANKNLKAEISFSPDIGISLFSHFPNLSLELKDIRIVNQKPFQGDTLLNLGKLNTTVHLMSVIKGDQVKIKSLALEDARIITHVLNDGRANWDIMKETGEEEPETTDTAEPAPLKMALDQYRVKNAYFKYHDESMPFLMELRGVDHRGDGNFTLDVFDLNTQTSVKRLLMSYDGTTYLKNVNTGLDAVININMPEFKFTFKDNLLRLNRFFTHFDGFVAMPEEDIVMDLSFAAEKTRFRNLVSLVPAVYSAGIDKVKSSGKLAFNGKVKGVYGENSMPAYQVHLAVENGAFRYPEYPSALNNVNLFLDVDNPDGVSDHTVINMKKLHFELNQEPFDSRMLVKTPVSDPFIDASVYGKIDLSNVKDLLPLEDVQKLKGVVKPDLSFSGNLSTLEVERYEEFKAAGNLIVSNFWYESKDLAEAVNIGNCEMSFTPQHVQLKRLDMKLGGSDMYASGQLENMLAYVFKDETLYGKLDIRSSYFDVNPWMVEEETPDQPAQEQTQEGPAYEMEAAEIPGNIDFELDARFKRLLFQDLDLNNVNGRIVVRDRSLILDNLSMGLFEGSFTAKGRYVTQQPEKPRALFDLKINGFDITKTYETFVTVRKFAPIARYMKGKFNGDLNLQMDLTREMEPIYKTVYSKGQLEINRAVVEGTPVLQKIAGALKKEEYKRLVLTDIRPSYKIEGGRFYLTKPIEFDVKESHVKVTGSSGLGQSLDYTMRTRVPAGKVKGAANKWLSSVAGREVNVPVGEHIVVDLKITGTMDQPRIRPVYAGTGEKSLKETAKEKAREVVDKKKKELKKKAQKEIDKKKKEVKKKVEKEKKKAEKKLEKKKEEAKEKAKKELDKKKKDVRDKAKDKIKDIFK